MKRNYIIIFCLFLLSTGVCLGKSVDNSFSAKENLLFETKSIKMQNEGGDSIFVTADVLPEFPGGYEELMKYLSTNIVYPTKAKEEGVQGQVDRKSVV